MSEIQVGWTAFGHVRERNTASGDASTANRIGDVTIAYKRRLLNADEGSLAVAVQPFATLPIGGRPIGEGDWRAGLLVPMSYELGHGLEFQLTPEIDAAADDDGSGRHLAYGTVVGLGIEVSETISAGLEFSMFRDRDPAGHASETLAALSVAWQPAPDSQLDVGTTVGLNRGAADFRLYLGVARRF